MSAVVAVNYTRTMADLFGFLILLATTASLVAYFVCSLAAVKLGVGRKVVPIFALAAIFSLWAIWGAGTEAIKWGAALLASGIPLYFLMRWRGRPTPAPEADPASPAE
jgi:APA family basic amino acid/polyamine antiporter